MLRFWKWYQKCLSVHPVKTQMISSGLIWGLGDIAAQSVTHYTIRKDLIIQVIRISVRFLLVPCILYSYGEEKNPKINWRRVATTSLFGLGFVGPVGHFWYEGLDRYIKSRMLLRPNSLQFVASKVAIDCLVFGPFDLLIFFTYMGFSSGKSIRQIKEDVKRDFLPAFMLEGGIWPVVQVVNFRFVPVRYQLLYVNFFCLLDSCFLSWFEQQEDAPWKQWLLSVGHFKDKNGRGG